MSPARDSSCTIIIASPLLYKEYFIPSMVAVSCARAKQKARQERTVSKNFLIKNMFCVNNCFQAALRLEYHGGGNGISRGMRSRLIPTQNIAFLKTPVRQQPPHLRRCLHKRQYRPAFNRCGKHCVSYLHAVRSKLRSLNCEDKMRITRCSLPRHCMRRFGTQRQR